MYPTRKAILIGSQNQNSKFLPGVEHDPLRMASYLQSPNGGKWRDTEIIVLKNPTRKQVLELIQNIQVDYLFVYFSGHGATGRSRKRVLSLYNEMVYDIELLSKSPRQVILVDACRTYLPSISGIPWGVERWQYATGYSYAREAFDQYILSSPFGKLIIHATEDNKPSYDDSQRNGGQFSLALLESVYQYQQTGQRRPLHWDTLLRHTGTLLAANNVDQVPGVVYQEGNLTVPFGIISPDIIHRPERTLQPYSTSTGVNWGGVLTVAGILLTAYALSQNRKK